MRFFVAVVVRLLPVPPTSILKRGSKEGMQALMRPMLSSRQLQITEEVRFPVLRQVRIAKKKQKGRSLGVKLRKMAVCKSMVKKLTGHVFFGGMDDLNHSHDASNAYADRVMTVSIQMS